jgi:hypothetical protein
VKCDRIPGYVVIVSHLRECDFCADFACYDAVTVHGGWANLCTRHFNELTHGRLGVGFGQYLVPSEEMEAGGILPDNVVREIEAAA